MPMHAAPDMMVQYMQYGTRHDLQSHAHGGLQFLAIISPCLLRPVVSHMQDPVLYAPTQKSGLDKKMVLEHG